MARYLYRQDNGYERPLRQCQTLEEAVGLATDIAQDGYAGPEAGGPNVGYVVDTETEEYHEVQWPPKHGTR